MQTSSRVLLTLGCVVAAWACGSRAPASELTISRDAVQTLILDTVFNDHGRWYLVKGACYAFMDHPRVGLAAGRLVIDGHLSSRVGLDVGGSCVGADLASDVRLSGRFVAAGSLITLKDIRIDEVKDESMRQALDLLQSAAGASLPRAVDIDLMRLLEPTIAPGTPIRVAVTRLAVTAVTTQPDGVTVDFEMKLDAR